jgi:hypothetical protein
MNSSSEKARQVDKHIKRFKQIHKTPICLAQGQCDGNIGRSHTISEATSLKYIAENEHVLVRQPNLYTLSKKDLLSFKKLSVHEALTFKGFCNRHDNELFKSLDRSSFTVTLEQLFMQAYRCDCREYYFKVCQVQTILDAAQIAEIHGLPTDINYELSPELELSRASMYQGLADSIASKEKFEKYLINKDYGRLRSFVVHAQCSPMIASAGSFFPDVLTSGEILQDFTNSESRLQSLFLSFIPEQNAMFVVFSFFDDEAMAPIKFIKDLIRTNKLPARLIWLCLTRLENTALKPSWWDTLPNDVRESINEAVSYNADIFDTRLPTFDRMPDFSDYDWQIVHQFWI